LQQIINDNHNIDKAVKYEFMDYINDALLWIYTHENPTVIDYKIKIDDVNEYTNKIFAENVNALNNVVSDRESMEQLCYSILGSIDSNMFEPTDDIAELKSYINALMVKLMDYDINTYKTTRIGDNNDNTIDIDFRAEIDNINAKCNNIYNKMNNVDIS